MTTTPACPAAYIRVAAATTADDIRMDRQRDVVTEAARRLGWPQPVLYADTGPAAQPASQHAALTDAISHGRHDAVIITDAARISRSAAQLQAFAVHCSHHGTRLYLTTGDHRHQPDHPAHRPLALHPPQPPGRNHTGRARPAPLAPPTQSPRKRAHHPGGPTRPPPPRRRSRPPGPHHRPYTTSKARPPGAQIPKPGCPPGTTQPRRCYHHSGVAPITHSDPPPGHLAQSRPPAPRRHRPPWRATDKPR